MQDAMVLTVGGEVPVVLLVLRGLGLLVPGLGVVVLGGHRLHVAAVAPPLALAAGVRAGDHCLAAAAPAPAPGHGHLGGLRGAIVVTCNTQTS